MSATSPSNALIVDLQLAIDTNNSDQAATLPSHSDFTEWATLSYRLSQPGQDFTAAEMTLRIVSEAEMQSLNETYRGKPGTTNVLSFPFESQAELQLPCETSSFENEALDCPLLGDVVICHAVVQREALQQEKLLHHHYAHMVVHGVLHLVGFDHLNDVQAEQMESLETQILSSLGMPNPYQ